MAHCFGHLLFCYLAPEIHYFHPNSSNISLYTEMSLAYLLIPVFCGLMFQLEHNRLVNEDGSPLAKNAIKIKAISLLMSMVTHRKSATSRQNPRAIGYSTNHW